MLSEVGSVVAAVKDLSPDAALQSSEAGLVASAAIDPSSDAALRFSENDSMRSVASDLLSDASFLPWSEVDLLIGAELDLSLGALALLVEITGEASCNLFMGGRFEACRASGGVFERLLLDMLV